MIEKINFLYEILVRFDNNGMLACHAVDAEVIIDDGNIINMRTFGARPVSIEDAAGLMNDNVAKMVAQVERVEAENNALSKYLTDAKNDAAKKSAELDAALAAVADLTSKLDTAVKLAMQMRTERDEARKAHAELLKAAQANVGGAV